MRFPGQYFDSETGTHYNYFRDYDPAIGRYIESDPIGLKGGPNTYLYADATPLTESDPSGLAPRQKPGDERYRPCNRKESDECRAICGARGVLKCDVKQRLAPTRALVGPSEQVLIQYEWKDGPMSCVCNESEDGILKKCWDFLTGPNPYRNPFGSGAGPFPFPVSPLPIP